MKNDADHKFLATLRSSPLGAKIVDDAEKGRLARRREALKKEAAIRATEAKFMDKLRAGEAEIADRRNIFEAAEMALREPQRALHGAATRRYTPRRSGTRGRRGPLQRASRQQPAPPRTSVGAAPPRGRTIPQRAVVMRSEEPRNKSGVQNATAKGKLAFFAFNIGPDRVSHARRITREWVYPILSVDDGDDTLVLIREAILTAAPSADSVVNIPPGPDGVRQAKIAK